MKRILSFFVAACFLFSLAACGEQSENSAGKTNGTNTTANQEQPQQTDPKEFEPIVVMDHGGIKVTLTGMAQTTDTSDGYLQFLAENNTDQDIFIQARDVVINGYMHEPRMNIEVAAGKKANDKMKFDATGLVLCEIEVIGDIQFSLHCITQGFDPIFDSEPFYFQTPDYSNASPPYVPYGGALYDDSSVKITSEGINSPGEYGQYAFFYIENNGDTSITVQSRNVSVNGFMVDPVFSVEVIPGAKAVDYMRIPADQLSANGIERVDSMELEFRIIDNENWENSFNSDAISFNYNYQ